MDMSEPTSAVLSTVEVAQLAAFVHMEEQVAYLRKPLPES
jgi:hypothetical protein